MGQLTIFHYPFARGKMPPEIAQLKRLYIHYENGGKDKDDKEYN